MSMRRLSATALLIAALVHIPWPSLTFVGLAYVASIPFSVRYYRKLEKEHADDVAELYVNLVQSKGGTALSSLKGNRPLIQRLIKVMDEGWTSSGEQKCIKFLKSLL